jgi:hypothetical protein
MVEDADADADADGSDRFNFTFREYCFNGLSYILNGNNIKYNFCVSCLLLLVVMTEEADIINIYYSHIMFIMFYIPR